MDQLMKLFDTAWGIVLGVIMGTTGLGSFIVNIVSSLKQYRLKKRQFELEAENRFKDDRISEQYAYIAKIEKMFTIQTNIITASFLNSNVGVETKRYITAQAEELKSLGNTTIQKAVEVAKESVEHAAEIVRETGDAIKNVATETVEKAKEIKQNTADLYNKIVSLGE